MNVNLICPQHKQQVIQACIDVDCSVFPFMCKVCLSEQVTVAQHTKHNQCLKPYQQYVTVVSKQIEDNLQDVNKFLELFHRESQIIQQFFLSDEHLNNMEGYIRSQKELIEQDIKSAVESLTLLFQLQKTELLNKLDQFTRVYKSNFYLLKEMVEPIHFLVSKCKYYANENNLKVNFVFSQQKLHTKPDLGLQLKASLKQMAILKKPDQVKQALETLKKSQMLSYNNESFNKLINDSLNSIKDYFTCNVQIPNITPIEVPQIQTQVPQQVPQVPQITSPKLKPMEISYADKVTMQDDNKTVISSVDSKVSITQPPMINVSILDSRILEDLSKNHQHSKFKIKKKLSLEFVVSSLALVGSTFVALGLADGTLKLLDMTTSKVSFYPNTYIQHTKPVCQLIVLKQNKGTRLASLSDENYAIIWTLGENYVPYPERKLVGFKTKLNRLMDIADCSHVLCQCDTNLHIVNYHDNRIAYSFDFKSQLIEFLYVSKFEKFATIAQGNIVSIYSLKMNNNMQGAMLLVNCELECIQPATQISNISTCIATEHLNDIVICYGCTDGWIRIFNVLKNTLLGEYQLFTCKIKEIVIVKQVKSFILVVFAENMKQIKGVMVQENKLIPIEKYGELLECLAKSGKNVLQTFMRNRSSILLLGESQRDIGLYELC